MSCCELSDNGTISVAVLLSVIQIPNVIGSVIKTSTDDTREGRWTAGDSIDSHRLLDLR